MKKSFRLFLGLSFFFSLSALAVPDQDFQKVYDLLEHGQGSFYRQGAFQGTGGVRIAYTRFGGKQKGIHGSIVIAPGRTESSLKYTEVAYDLIDQGFSPIYVLDHRGQGFSERLLSDPQKGYIPDYAVYENDFSAFVQLVLKDKSVDRKNLFLLSHSMGGAIVTEYLMNLKEASPFRAAAFISPMYKIADKRSEAELIRDTGYACYLLFQCKDYIPDGGPFRWENRHFENNDLTHSLLRFRFRDHLWKTRPQLQLGDPTIRWVRESVQADIRIRDITKLSRLRLPFLIFQGTKDTVTDAQGAVEVCRRMKSPCTRLLVKGARHEILMETQNLRSAALKRVENFFKRPLRKGL
jgi:lysophospholipase